MKRLALRLTSALIRSLERLREWLQRPPPPKAAPRGDALSRLPPEYARELIALIRQGRNVSAGRLEVLGIERVKQHYAQHWEDVHDKINAVIRLIINRHLNPQDACAQVRSCHFILLFADIPLREATEKTAQISQEIYDTLIDHPDIGAYLLVKNATGRVDEMDFSNFDAFLENLKTAPVKPRVKKQQEIVVAPEEVGFKAMPVWDAEHRRLVGYQCFSAVAGADDPDDETLSQTDQTALGQARQIFDTTREAQNLLIFCPVNFKAIQNPKTRAKFTQICQTLPPEMRARLAFEVMGIPRSLEVPNVNGVLENIRDYCNVIVAGARIDRPPSDNLCKGSVNGISLDLRGIQTFQPQIQKMLDAFSGHAKKNKLRLMAHGIKCPTLAEKTAAAGFNTIDGEALHPPLEQADPALSLD